MAVKTMQKPMSKSELVLRLAAATVDGVQISKKQVSLFLEELVSVATAQLNKVGKFTVPGLVILTRRRKEAVKGGEVKRGPQGEYVTKKQPARNVVKARPVKAVKDAV